MLHPKTMRIAALTAASVLLLRSSPSPAQTEQAATNTAFPYVIPCEPGTSAFAPGDHITITSLRGDRRHLEADGSYLVQGSYTLSSADRAVLLFSCTSRGPSGPTPISAGQEIKVTRGTGTFTLKHTTPCDGWFHVSFYMANEGHSHGGVYFGEKGVEKTILRKTDWPDLAESPSSPGRSPKLAGGGTHGIASDPANLAILEYLGNSVPAPAQLDPKYSPANLERAFSALGRNEGLHIERLAVDDSEFPFLVYGLLEGRVDFRELEKGLGKLEGYNYGGSVVGTADNGSTYFSLNIIPRSQYPASRTTACNRRLMVRLQMLADKARRPE